MRLWIGATSSFGGPVMIVKVRTVSPLCGSFQFSHRPAIAKGVPSALTIA